MEQTFTRRRWLLPVVLALLTILYLKPLIFTNNPSQGLDSKDMLSMNYPLHEYISQTVHAGELPLWNPHEFIGHPISGNPQSALFYPATWFIWLVGVIRGINLSMAFHVWWGAWGMAILTRRFKASYVASILAGVIYTMSGLAAARFYGGHYVLFVTLSWIPWIVAAYHYAITRGTWRSTLPGIGATGIALLAGNTQMLLYAGIAMVILWAYHLINIDTSAVHVGTENLQKAFLQAGRQLVVMIIGGAILSAALLLPTLELAQLSARSATDLSFANSFVLPPAQLLTLVFPEFFGNPKATQPYLVYWGADFYEELNAYAGLLPLLAIPLAFRFKRRENWYFLTLVALGLVMSLGLDGSLMPILWQWIPGFTAFRGPAHALVLAVIGMAGLTAMLITTLQASTIDERRERLRPIVRLWLPITIGGLFAGAAIFAGWYASASHVEPMPIRALAESGALVKAAIILSGIFLVLWLWSDTNIKTAQWALLLTCVVVILDAWRVGPTVIAVKAIGEDPIWAGAQINVPTGPDARVVAPLGFENEANVTGHLNVSGYDPLILESYQKLQALSDVNDPKTPVNTLLGVKYLMAAKPFDQPDFKLIGIADGGIYYRREDAFPRAWVAKTLTVESNDDAVRQQIVSGKQNLAETVYIDHAIDCSAAGGTASITGYHANSVDITTSGDGGLLTLSDQYYPGWQAMVDGRTVDIVRADTVFRGVCIPAGDHTVHFEYRPSSVLFGVIISGIGWSLWIMLMLVSIVRGQHDYKIHNQ